jgi:hypothetical protein
VSVVCFGAFMGQLDASIVAITFPAMQREFSAPVAAVQWVSLSYLLGLIAMLAPAGRLGDAVGRKLVYTYGFVAFHGGLRGLRTGARPDPGWAADRDGRLARGLLGERSRRHRGRGRRALPAAADPAVQSAGQVRRAGHRVAGDLDQRASARALRGVRTEPAGLAGRAAGGPRGCSGPGRWRSA